MADVATGVLASGNLYYVTQDAVNISSPDGVVIKQLAVDNLTGVSRDSATVRIRNNNNDYFTLITTSPDAAADIERLLILTVPAMAASPATQTFTKTQIIRILAAVVLLVFFVAAFLITGGDDDSDASSDRARVVYDVTDTSRGTVSLTYENAGGNSQQESNAVTPWGKRYSMDSGDFVYVSAQRGQGTGTVRCTITIDGEVVEQAESTGEFVIATCSGSVP